MRLIITGGHLTPAIALIQESISHQDKILFIGRKYASSNNLVLSREKAEVENLSASFQSISTPKIERSQLTASLLKAPQLFFSIFQASTIISRFKPDIIVSFGGYLSIPVAIAAKLKSIPIIIHEQTHAAGLANRVISKFAIKIALSYPSSQSYFPSTKTVITGNPIRQSFYANSLKKPSWIPKPAKPILYITGGNQGSLIINQTIKQILPKITKSFLVIHSCGSSQIHRYFDSLNQARQELPHKNNYLIRQWLTQTEVAWVVNNSSLIITRSGANIVHEILYAKKPAILIPLPFAQKQEQLKNAQMLKASGLGFILSQDQLTPQTLHQSINYVLKHHSQFTFKKLSSYYDPQKAAARLYQLIVKNTPSKLDEKKKSQTPPKQKTTIS